MSCVPVTGVSELSDVSGTCGGVQWNILSNLPGECYGSYFLKLNECRIMSFTILPTLSGAAVNGTYIGELIMVYVI